MPWSIGMEAWLAIPNFQTTAYQQGEVRTTHLSQQQTGQGVTVIISASSGSYAGAQSKRDNVIQLVLPDADSNQRVTLNGNSLQQYYTQAKFETAVKGWYCADARLILDKSGALTVASHKTFEF